MLHIITDENSTLAGFIINPLHSVAGVNIIQFSKRRKNFFQKAIRYFESKFFLINGGLSLQGETKNALSEISKNDSVLFFDIDYVRDIEVICKAIPEAKKKSIFLWNPLQAHDGKAAKSKRNLNILKNLFDRVSTFDPDDAKEYNIDLVAQPFLEIDNNLSLEKNIDIYFIGSDKGRLDRLISIKEIAKSQGLGCNFIITPSKRINYSKADVDHLSFSKIPYSKNIHLAMQSRCLLEIVQDNQSGPTMRTMEAAFLGCKLITNRKSAVQDVFYHPSNTLIIEEGESYDFQAFIKSKYVDYSEKIHETHNINNWWRQFL